MVDIVLTGFAPFDGAATNPSWEAVQLAAHTLREMGLSVEIAELSVEFDAAPVQVAELLVKHRPTVFIATGVAGSAAAVRLEQVAVNTIDARIPDNAGSQPQGVPVIADGVVELHTTLPISITEAWSASGIPWEHSHNAGRYVCNATFYSLQHITSQQEFDFAAVTGFIHVPPAEVLPIAQSAQAIHIAATQSLESVCKV
jgi:pyroglutamyl-peptidase